MTAIVEMVILGAMSDGLVVLETLRQMAAAGLPVRPVGFLDDGLATGSTLADLPILGRLEDWAELPRHWLLIPVLHKLKRMPERVARVNGLNVPPERWGSAVHPTAVIAGDCTVGLGSYLGPNVVIQPGVRLGNFLSIRAGASLGHEAVLDDFAYVGPNSVLCGRASLGRAAHLSAGAVVTDDVQVGEFSVVGAVSAVNRDVPPYSLAAGNPARIVAHLEGGR